MLNRNVRYLTGVSQRWRPGFQTIFSAASRRRLSLL
jgi:hypothetical protein